MKFEKQPICKMSSYRTFFYYSLIINDFYNFVILFFHAITKNKLCSKLASL